MMERLNHTLLQLLRSYTEQQVELEHYLPFVLLNQARAGLWPTCAWFLKIDSVWIVDMRACVCVCVCVCVSGTEAINN